MPVIDLGVHTIKPEILCALFSIRIYSYVCLVLPHINVSFFHWKQPKKFQYFIFAIDASISAVVRLSLSLLAASLRLNELSNKN